MWECRRLRPESGNNPKITKERAGKLENNFAKLKFSKDEKSCGLVPTQVQILSPTLIFS